MQESYAMFCYLMYTQFKRKTAFSTLFSLDDSMDGNLHEFQTKKLKKKWGDFYVVTVDKYQLDI